MRLYGSVHGIIGKGGRTLMPPLLTLIFCGLGWKYYDSFSYRLHVSMRVSCGFDHSWGITKRFEIRWHIYSLVTISLSTRDTKVELIGSQQLHHSHQQESWSLEGNVWTWHHWLLKSKSWREWRSMAPLVLVISYKYWLHMKIYFVKNLKTCFIWYVYFN